VFTVKSGVDTWVTASLESKRGNIAGQHSGADEGQNKQDQKS